MKNGSKISLVTAFLTLVITFMTLQDLKAQQDSLCCKDSILTIKQERPQLSKRDSIIYYYLDTISFYLDSFQIEQQQYVLAQALWETGWFQCDNCAWSKGNNLFGFRGQNGYIKYDSWVLSVEAYSKWQKRRYLPYKETHPNSTYTQFLVWAKYATSPTYITHVNYMYNWLGKNYYNVN